MTGIIDLKVFSYTEGAPSFLDFVGMNATIRTHQKNHCLPSSGFSTFFKLLILMF